MSKSESKSKVKGVLRKHLHVCVLLILSQNAQSTDVYIPVENKLLKKSCWECIPAHSDAARRSCSERQRTHWAPRATWLTERTPVGALPPPVTPHRLSVSLSQGSAGRFADKMRTTPQTNFSLSSVRTAAHGSFCVFAAAGKETSGHMQSLIHRSLGPSDCWLQNKKT